ncbi:MAG TPA: DNA topoisomerase IV subunit A, partial [Wenzhouxiangella sp.]
KAGKQILSVPKGGMALGIEPVSDPKEGILLAVTSSGYLLAFYVEQLPELAKGKGNKLINIPAKARSEGEHMVGAVVLAEGGEALVWAGQRYLKIGWSDTDHYWGERAQRGRKLPRGFQKVTRLTLADA